MIIKDLNIIFFFNCQVIFDEDYNDDRDVNNNEDDNGENDG